MALPPLGQQLGVFNSKYKLDTDADVVLDAVRAAGLSAIEGGTTASAKVREGLARRGIRFGGGHCTMTVLDDPERLAAGLREVGCEDLCNSGILRWNDRDEALYRESIAKLNEAGRALRRHGIRLHYHNHDFEFTERFGAKRGIDLLAEGLDPEACDLCIDVAWVRKGGDDPACFLDRHRDRIGYVHLKDYDDAGWIELGRGQVPLGEVVRVLGTMSRVRWAMIEQDKTALDPVESVALSRAYLRDTFAY
jgi:sugar phosphate isomerase/epimerase